MSSAQPLNKEPGEKEEHSNLELRDICEQLIVNADERIKSLSNVIETYKDAKKLDTNLKNEKKRSIILVQEKKEMMRKISYLEKCNKDISQKLKNTEDQLNFTLGEKLEIENKYASEIAKMDKLKKKCGELEELKNKLKAEFEGLEELKNKLKAEFEAYLKTAMSSVENHLNGLALKLEEFEQVTLNEREEEKAPLENGISNIEETKKESKANKAKKGGLTKESSKSVEIIDLEEPPKPSKRGRKRKLEEKVNLVDCSISLEVANISRNGANTEENSEAPAAKKNTDEEKTKAKKRPKSAAVVEDGKENEKLPEGWARKVVVRESGKTAGQIDVYIFSPDGYKFRSKKEVAAYLANTKSDLRLEDFYFDFSKKKVSDDFVGNSTT